MPSGKQIKTPKAYFILAGLEAGVLGGVLMLVVLAVHSALRTGSPWTSANLLASTFYGDAAFVPAFRATTFAGVALHLAIAGVLGMLFGFVIRESGNGLRVFLIGVIFGLGWYYIAYRVLWRPVNPLVPLYTAERPTLVGHLMLGMVLGRFPRWLEGVRRGFSVEPPPALPIERPLSE